MTEITNIVPVTPSEQAQAPEEATVETEAIQQQEELSYSQKLADDAIKFMDQEFKEDVNGEFWEAILLECQKRLGRIPAELPEMTPEQYKDFATEEIPIGRYAGQRFGTVTKRDRASMERLASNPLQFQIRLQRFLKTSPPPKGRKKV